MLNYSQIGIIQSFSSICTIELDKNYQPEKYVFFEGKVEYLDDYERLREFIRNVTEGDYF